MKYTFAISLRLGQQVHRAKRVLAAGNSELSWHIALKLLGLLLFWEDEPRVEEGVGWHYKPDLVAFAPDGCVRLWVDCGNISARKIDRVTAWLGEGGRFVILRRQRRDAEALVRSLRGRVRRRDRVEILHFDRGFVDDLAAHLAGVNAVAAERGPGRLCATVENRRGERSLTSGVHQIDPGF